MFPFCCFYYFLYYIIFLFQKTDFREIENTVFFLCVCTVENVLIPENYENITLILLNH